MSILKLVPRPGKAAEPIDALAPYAISEREESHGILELVLTGPTDPGGRVVFAVNSADSDAVRQARAAAAELALARNQDVQFGAAQALAAFNATVDRLLTRHGAPLSLDRAMLAALGGAHPKTCQIGPRGKARIARSSTYTGAIECLDSESE